MKKYKLSSLIIAGALVLTLSACGSNSKTTTTPETQTTTTTEATESTESTEVKEITETTETSEEVPNEPSKEVTLTGKRIEPLFASQALENLNHIEESILTVKFTGEDISVEDGKLAVHLDVYASQIFDVFDIIELAVGDIMVINGEEVVVYEIKRDSGVSINGGLAEGGHDFNALEESGGVYFETLTNLVERQYYFGEVTLQADEKFEFIDNSDLNNVVVYTSDEFISKFMGTDEYFSEYETSAYIKDGALMSISFNNVP